MRFGIPRLLPFYFEKSAVIWRKLHIGYIGFVADFGVCRFGKKEQKKRKKIQLFAVKSRNCI